VSARPTSGRKAKGLTLARAILRPEQPPFTARRKPMLKGKRGLILGVANKRSLAWAIAQSCVEHGAEIALTCLGDRFEPVVRKLAAQLPNGDDIPILKVDVVQEEQIDEAAAALGRKWDRLDFIVHSIAYANPDELKGRFRDTTRDGFNIALDISAYSVISVSRAFAPMMTEGGSVVALSYLGGERVVPNYNVMGVAKAALDSAMRYLSYDLGPQNIRVNSVAPGPVRTVSASSVGDFASMLSHVESVAPLRRNITGAEVGNVVAFLCSDLASGATGTHIPVDSGFTILGLTAGIKPPIVVEGSSDA
jgi:enoyl-[acyl-carrier protein] reductase I